MSELKRAHSDTIEQVSFLHFAFGSERAEQRNHSGLKLVEHALLLGRHAQARERRQRVQHGAAQLGGVGCPQLPAQLAQRSQPCEQKRQRQQRARVHVQQQRAHELYTCALRVREWFAPIVK